MANEPQRSEGYEEEAAAELAKMKMDLDNRFTYHAPKPGQSEKYEALRAKAKELAYLIVELTPRSREQSLAITNLESCIFNANAAIARN